MTDQDPSLNIQVPNQGWKQFLVARDEMLAAYDRARVLNTNRPVHTSHGQVAEAEFRKWLSNFLPKRYGVTSGYIISQGMPNTATTVHYDVIIYDQLESPVLWVDGDTDTSSAGRSLAIPVEYVRGVIEIKSAFKKRTVEQAVAQLAKLKPLMAIGVTAKTATPLYLPRDFFCATVFFELRKEDEMDFAALDSLAEASTLRGFYGGYILRSEPLGKYHSGKLSLQLLQEDREPWHKSLFFLSSSNSKKIGEHLYLKTQLHHSETHFSEFAFDIIALLKGRYHPNVLSSFYGFGTTQWEAGHAADTNYFNPDDVKRYQEETEKFFKIQKL